MRLEETSQEDLDGIADSIGQLLGVVAVFREHQDRLRAIVQTVISDEQFREAVVEDYRMLGASMRAIRNERDDKRAKRLLDNADLLYNERAP